MFNSPVWYTLCTTEKMFYAEMRKCGIKRENAGNWISSPNANATAHQFTITENNRACCIVCINATEDRDSILIAGLLVHESVHIWQQVCRSIGEVSPSDEFMAYGIQWISQQLMWEFVRQTQGVK